MNSRPIIPGSKVIHDYVDTTYWNTTNLYQNEVEGEIINEQVL